MPLVLGSVCNSVGVTELQAKDAVRRDLDCRRYKATVLLIDASYALTIGSLPNDTNK